MRKFIGTVTIVIVVLFVVGVLLSLGGVMSLLQPRMAKVDKSSILVMDLEGIIIDGSKFLEDLRKYAKEEKIKGVLVQVNSPGGVVGPSQAIFRELKRVREELQKPVVVSANAMAASGAYYAAVAADQIVTNPGTLMGSIGVIMEFANLEHLYDWAKIKRFVIKTGPYKDSGADYRPMTEAERALFQELIGEVHRQFKQAVQQGRKLAQDVVDRYSDGRVFTGESAVKLGFADQLGNFEDAVRVIGELSGLGDDPELFRPPKRRPDFLEMLVEARSQVDLWGVAKKALKTQLLGQPLYLLPGSAGI